MIGIDGLQGFLDRLAALDVERAQRDALADVASRIADAVRDTLSSPPGGNHTAPWLRTGALRDSIGYQIDGDQASIGSTSPVALFQETGTRSAAPRPFLAPTAAREAAAAAEAIGAAIAALLAGDAA